MNFPAKQSTQTLGRKMNFPGRHSLQLPAMPPVQTLHCAAEERPVAPLHRPEGQLWLQAEVAAIREENRPTAHSVHCRYAESPVLFDHRPSMQGPARPRFSSKAATVDLWPISLPHRPCGNPAHSSSEARPVLLLYRPGLQRPAHIPSLVSPVSFDHLPLMHRPIQ